MGEGRQYPNIEYYTVIMANQDTIAEAESHWVPRVRWTGTWTCMKPTVTKPPASVATVILRAGEGPLPPSPPTPLDSHPLASHTTLLSCSSLPSTPAPLEPCQELFFLTRSVCLFQAWSRGSHHGPAPQPHASQIQGGSDR